MKVSIKCILNFLHYIHFLQYSIWKIFKIFFYWFCYYYGMSAAQTLQDKLPLKSNLVWFIPNVWAVVIVILANITNCFSVAKILAEHQWNGSIQSISTWSVCIALPLCPHIIPDLGNLAVLMRAHINSLPGLIKAVTVKHKPVMC